MAKSTEFNQRLAIMRRLRQFLKKFPGFNPNGLKYNEMIRQFADKAGMEIVGAPKDWIVNVYNEGKVPECARTIARGIDPAVWRNLRKTVLKMYPNKCMKCGGTHRLAIDHIKPVILYPELATDIDNLQILCQSCNSVKGHRHFTDFRQLVG